MLIKKNNINKIWNANSERPDSLYHMRKDKEGKTTHFGPDETELLIHKKALDRIVLKNKKMGQPTKVLVLGATPELRDLALEKKCEVFAVDINEKVIEAAKQHLRINNRKDESIIISDWSKLSLKDKSINFVIGSASLNNVPPEQLTKVFYEIKRIWSKHGIAQFRQITFPDKHKPEYEFSNVIKGYRKGKVSKREFYVILRFYSFLDDAYDNKKHILYAKKVFDKFDKLYEAGKLTDDEHFYLTSFRNEVQHTVFSQEKTKKLFEKYFGSTKILHGKGEKYFKDVYNIFEVKNEIKK